MKQLVNFICPSICMYWIKIFFVLFVMSFPLKNFAQAPSKKTNQINAWWNAYFLKVKLNEKWGIYGDAGIRRNLSDGTWNQRLIRLGVNYFLKEGISATLGGAYFETLSGSVYRPELRPWLQLMFHQKHGRFSIGHRLREEQRFFRNISNGELVKGYRYNFRFRYQLSMRIAITKAQLEDKTLYLLLSDEAMINSGKNIIYNYFDQNRFNIGPGFKFNKYLDIAICYMNLFRQRESGNVFDNQHTLSVLLYQDF